MSECDYPREVYYTYQELEEVTRWVLQVSGHKPCNAFAPPAADGEFDFYSKRKSGARSKSSSTTNHREEKHSIWHKWRGYQSDLADSDSDSDGGPDRPPTPTNDPEMWEDDFPREVYYTYQEMQEVAKWVQEVSKHKPCNAFAPPAADGEFDFYSKRKTGSRSKSSSTANPREGKYSVSHKRRGYQNDFADSDSNSDGGPNRPPTPTNKPDSYSFSRPYGKLPQPATRPINSGYVNVLPPVQNPRQQQQSQPPIVTSNITGQPLIPVFNQRTNAWEYHEPVFASSAPPGQSQMFGGMGGFIHNEQPELSLQPLPGLPLSGPPNGSTQPAMSTMHSSLDHTLPASDQGLSWVSASNPHDPQIQQQQALQARYQQQQQQEPQQQQMREQTPVAPILTTISLPMLHTQGEEQATSAQAVLPPTAGCSRHPYSLGEHMAPSKLGESPPPLFYMPPPPGSTITDTANSIAPTPFSLPFSVGSLPGSASTEGSMTIYRGYQESFRDSVVSL